MASLTADDFSAEAREKKLIEAVKKTYLDLRILFEADDVDWDKFLFLQTKFELLDSQAESKGVVEASKLLQECTPNFTEPSSLLTTLHKAAYENQMQVVNWCLEAKADVNVKSALGRTPLHVACDGDAVRCMHMLLEAAADANAVSLSLLTPLHLCCRKGSYNAVIALLECDQIVDVNNTDSQNRRPDMLTKDKMITRAITKYRTKMDRKKKVGLVQYKLLRLFKAIDKDGDGFINEYEWTLAQARLARYFKDHCEEAIGVAFNAADKDGDKLVDYEEFKKLHLDMMEAVGTQHKTVMSNLNDMENMLFEDEKENLQRSATQKSEQMREMSAELSSLSLN